MLKKIRNFAIAAHLLLCMLPLASAQLTPNIWKKFIGEPVPVGTPDLIDYSYAGYKQGGEAIPDDFALRVFDVTDYGAVANDDKSDTEAIKTALKAASSGGGIVFFPPGQFDVLTAGETLEPIYVHGHNVILRGSGAGGAEHGGTTILQQNSPNVYKQLFRLFRTGWRVHNPTQKTTVSGSFPKGSKYFDVVDSSSLLSHRFVKITANVKGTSGDPDSWEDWNQFSSRSMDEMLASYTRIREEGIGVYELHEIDRIEGNRVYIKAPTITHLNSNFTVNYIDLAVGIGFEDLHIDGNLQERYEHHEYYGYGGIMLQLTAHSWIRRCRLSNTVNGFGLHNSYNTSAIGIIVDGKFGHQPSTVNASTYCFIGLLEDHSDEGHYHGSAVANRCAGTVLWRINGPTLRGPDTHGDFPRQTLFDNYHGRAHDNSGGAAQIRPSHLDGYTRWNNIVADGSTFNLWGPGNVSVTQANLIGYKTLGGSIPRDVYVEGFGIHVSPASLYEAQLERRLGALPAWVNASKDMYREFVERVLIDSPLTEPTETPPVDPNSGGPKIEGPWLWVLVPDEHLDKSTDLLAKASDGRVTDLQIATNGVSPGDIVGDYVWTPLKISTSGGNNITNMTRPLDWNGNNRVIYGFIPLNSPREHNTRMFVGSDDAVKVWLNGKLVHQRITRRSASDYKGSFPVTLRHGRNILLVAVDNASGGWSGFFGFQADAEYTVLPFAGIGYALPNVDISTGDTFTLDIYAEDATDLAAWQFDIAFDPLLLEAIDIRKGYFLESVGGVTSFHEGTIDNQSGKITGLSEAALNGNAVSGTGLLLSVTFTAKTGGETQLTLNNFRLGDSTGREIPAGPLKVAIVLKGKLIWDVNEDGKVNILDLVLVAQNIGKPTSVNSRADVNGDGTVNILDLVLVAQHIGESQVVTAPTNFTIDDIKGLNPETVHTWIQQAQLIDDGSPAIRKGIVNLQRILALLLPNETALLENYPNPFNPETWIPYQLSVPADVTLTIYAVNGTLIRTLALGQMPAGNYQSRTRAAYWDGKNNVGEPVASGIYFYTLTASEFSATRKMLILK